MNKIKNKKGFIFPVVLIIIIFLIVIVNSVTSLSISSTSGISKDYERSKAYYIANAGLEMVFSALNEDTGKGSILKRTGVAGNTEYNQAKKDIIKVDNLPFKNQNGEILGYLDIRGDLKERGSSFGSNLYYKITCTGKLKKDSKSPSDSHTLTMEVGPNNVSMPKVYEGKRES